MDSIIALIQGMGLFHLQWGQAVMIAISLLLLWLAISRKFEPLLLLALVDCYQTFLKPVSR